MTINKVILIGNLGRDPESRRTNSDLVIANLAIATSDKVKQGNEWKDKTEWHNVIFFGKTAENICQYCTKGSKVYIEGRLQTRKWEDKEGNTRYTTEIVGQVIKFLGAKQGNSEQNNTSSYSNSPNTTIKPVPLANFVGATSAIPQVVQTPFDEDDIPF